MQYAYKYTDSRSFIKRCKEISHEMETAMDVEVSNIETYPQLTINGKGFYPLTFGVHRAALIVANIEAIKIFAGGNDYQGYLMLHGKNQHVEMSLRSCKDIVKYEEAIKIFAADPKTLIK